MLSTSMIKLKECGKHFQSWMLGCFEVMLVPNWRGDPDSIGLFCWWFGYVWILLLPETLWFVVFTENGWPERIRVHRCAWHILKLLLAFQECQRVKLSSPTAIRMFRTMHHSSVNVWRKVQWFVPGSWLLFQSNSSGLRWTSPFAPEIKPRKGYGHINNHDQWCGLWCLGLPARCSMVQFAQNQVNGHHWTSESLWWVVTKESPRLERRFRPRCRRWSDKRSRWSHCLWSAWRVSKPFDERSARVGIDLYNMSIYRMYDDVYR